MKSFFIFLSCLILCLSNASVICAEEAKPPAEIKPSQETLDSALNKTQQKPTPPEASFEIPDWIKRTNIAISAGTDEKPKFFLETIQPLLGTQYKDLVFFNQTRISAKDYRTTYNIGFGLRKIFNKSYLLGINSFYDFQDLHQHHRTGVGFEAITDKGIEARLNSYIRVSNKRLVRDDGANDYYEKIAQGGDWEFGAPLPYLNFLKLYGGGYWYNFEHFKNKYGWKMRMEYNPLKYSRLVFEMLDDNKRNHPAYRFEGALTLAFTSFRLQDILNDLKMSKEAYPGINLEDKVLERVVRDFDITVIKSIQTKGGLTVEAGRSG